MTAKYIGKTGKEYSRNTIKKMSIGFEYWVILPRGTRKKHSFGICYTSMISVKTKKQAEKLQKKYNAPVVQFYSYSTEGRHLLKEWWFTNSKNWHAMWEEDQKNEEIEL
jgi:hypothetical protein